MNHNFYHHIQPVLVSSSDAPLITYTDIKGRRVTSAAPNLSDRIASYRAVLQHIAPREPVLLLMGMKGGATEAVLACMSLGLVPVAAPKDFFGFPAFVRRQRLSYVLLADDCSVVLRMVLKLLGLKPIKSCNKLEVLKVAALSVAADHPALLSFSSGSTGRHKRIVRSHGVLTAQHLALKRLFPPWHGQVDFPLFPNVILHNMAVGIPTVLPDIPSQGLKHFDPARIIFQLEYSGIQSMTGNVFYFSRLVTCAEEKKQVLPGVKGVVIGGSPVPERLLDRMQKVFSAADIYVLYGATEAEPIACRRFAGGHEIRWGYEVGQCVDEISLKLDPAHSITDAHLNTRPVGEVVVRGDHVMGDDEGWLHTGDWACRDEDNCIHLTARKGNEGVYKGRQHYYIEHQIRNSGWVEQVAAVYTPSGFRLYYQGAQDEQSVWDLIRELGLEVWVLSIAKKDQLPTDNRHHSKILYHLLG